MTTSLDSKHTHKLVTAMGGAHSDASAEPGPPTTIDTAALDGVLGGITDGSTPPDSPLPWPPPSPRPTQPDGLPPSPLPGPTIFNPSLPRPDKL